MTHPQHTSLIINCSGDNWAAEAIREAKERDIKLPPIDPNQEVAPMVNYTFRYESKKETPK